MKIGKVQREPVCVSPQSSVLEAIEIMEDSEVSMVIVSQGDRPIGLFTLRDVARKVARFKLDPSEVTLEEVMTTPVQWASREMEVREAVEEMLEHNIHHLPILDANGGIEGFVSFHYLLRDLLNETSGDLMTLQSYLGADGWGG